MNALHILTLAFSGALLAGCASSPKSATPVAATAEYSGRDPIATSLFHSDQAVLSDEAVGRMQADLLLVFRVGSDTYSQYRTFSKDKARAYSTSELVLLDVRTALVPFTRVVSRERLESKQPTDLDLSEAMRRAEQASAAEALKTAADDLVSFVKSVPKKGGQQDGAANRSQPLQLGTESTPLPAGSGR